MQNLVPQNTNQNLNELDSQSDLNKSFWLTNWALENATSVIIIMFLITFFGLISYNQMPKELFPEIKLPTIYVNTVYPGNSPLDIENLITRPIEKEINSVDGIKNLKSTSIQDFSIIIVEFNSEVDLEKALSDVKDAVDKAKSELPNDLDKDPTVMDIDLSEVPIMNINISGDYSIDELKSYAEDLEEDIEEISEIKRVDLKGALEREVNVMVDMNKLEALELSLNDVINAINYENVSISSGDVKFGKSNRSVRLVGEFQTPEEIENIIIKDEKQRVVYLNEVAEVINGYEDRKSFARLNGNPVVSLDVIKKSGENLLSATDQINALISKYQKGVFPADLTVVITNDQSEDTRNQIANLENSIIMGVILVVGVLLFFIGLRSAMMVGIAIPLSMLLSFGVLALYGATLNLIVLFSLILALGMLVDNGIVVVENVYRLYNMGFSAYESAKRGVGQIAVPIISSTATTLSAFFPLLFWNDTLGEFMGYIPLTLIIVLTASLLVALVINPVLLVKYVKKEQVNSKPNFKAIHRGAIILTFVGILLHFTSRHALGNLAIFFAILAYINVYILRPGEIWFQQKGLVWLENKYEKTLRFFLKGKRPAYLIGLYLPGLLIFSLILLGIVKPNVVFFPVNEPKYINTFIEMPVGSDVNYTDSVVRVVENKIFDVVKPYGKVVKSVVSNVGAGASDPNEGPSVGNSPNKARITISFVEFKFRNGVSSAQVMKEISAATTDIIPGCRISVEKNNEGPPVGKPINVEVSGKNYEELIANTDRLLKVMEEAKIPGIEGLKLDLELGKPEVVVTIDRSKARMFGLSTAQIGGTLRNALYGAEASKFKDGEDEYPINVKLKDSYRYDLATLINQRITFRDPTSGRIVQVPISAVADVKYTSSYGSVKRKDLERVITIYSNVLEGYNPNEINGKLKEILSAQPMPAGYTYKFTGEQEEQAKTLRFLTNALLIAVALIALILVAQFNSVTKPFIIITSVVFSTIRVFLGIAIFNMDLVILMTGIGIVSLAGVVVNNAIVLIDYTDLVRHRLREHNNIKEGEYLSVELAKEAIVESGKTRLRPVLLTAITTVLGLIPLAIGFNIDFFGLFESFAPDLYWGGDNALFWGPMAWTVIFGLTFATFLTLVAVPSMYLLIDIFNRKWRSFFAK
jgi:multidrug efflux pump subunit AcrB